MPKKYNRTRDEEKAMFANMQNGYIRKGRTRSFSTPAVSQAPVHVPQKEHNEARSVLMDALDEYDNNNDILHELRVKYIGDSVIIHYPFYDSETGGGYNEPQEKLKITYEDGEYKCQFYEDNRVVDEFETRSVERVHKALDSLIYDEEEYEERHPHDDYEQDRDM